MSTIKARAWAEVQRVDGRHRELIIRGIHRIARALAREVVADPESEVLIFRLATSGMNQKLRIAPNPAFSAIGTDCWCPLENLFPDELNRIVDRLGPDPRTGKLPAIKVTPRDAPLSRRP